jgi:uncharacterized transporter YbjL
MLSVASISRSNRRVLFANLKNIVFALFIFTPGFTGGLRFFANIGRGCRLRRAPLIVDIVVVVALVLGAVIVLKLDAGLLAGGATESAAIGTAPEAINRPACRRHRAAAGDYAARRSAARVAQARRAAAARSE